MSQVVSHLAHHLIVLADADFAIPNELCVDVGSQVTVKALVDGVTVSASVGTIDGDISIDLFEGESIQLVFDGADWHVI